MSVAQISKSVFFGLSVFTMRPNSPQVIPYTIDPTSATIREGDAVKEIAGGRIVRAAPSDTALLGIAAEGQSAGLPTSIAALPAPTDANGYPIILVYVFDVDTVFMGETLGVPTTALRTQVHDLAYAAAPPQPTTVTPTGTTGATTYSYYITAVTTVGESVVGTVRTTTTGNAALSATNYNAVTIPYVNARVVQFGIYNATGLLAYVNASVASPTTTAPTTVWNDTGYTAGAAAPTVDMSGWAINEAANSTGVVKIDSLDDRPISPFFAAQNVVNRLVRWRVPAAKSQFLGVAGS